MSLLGAAGIGGLFGLAGSLGQAAFAKKLQEDAQEHQKKMYRHRYQWTMEDMGAAGLNPILAYKQGPGSAGGSPMASAPDFGSAVTRGIEAGTSTAKKSSERDLIREQTQTTAAQGEKARAEARLNNARADKEEQLTPLYREVPGILQWGADRGKESLGPGGFLEPLLDPKGTARDFDEYLKRKARDPNYQGPKWRQKIREWRREK